MAPIYANFDLLITRAGEKYQARVVDSPSGQATSEFAAPFTEVDLEGLALTLQEARRGASVQEDTRAWGQHLFEAAFGGKVGEALHRSLDHCHSTGHGLRIRLRLGEVPDLAAWPWEFLYDPDLKRHLALSDQTPVVRFTDMLDVAAPLAVDAPLTVLVMISSPNDQEALDVEQEWSNLVEAMSALDGDKRVRLIRLEQATHESLRRALRQNRVHVLHYIGHGVFDERSQDGTLLFENEAGGTYRATSSFLGTLLHDQELLRLVVLNACQGATGSDTATYNGVAQSLVGQRLPAVLGMQFAISDRAAIAFSREFYRALADGYPVDAAVGEGRIAALAKGSGVEWATPVLYLRAPDGQLFHTRETGYMSDQEDTPRRGGGIKINVGGDVNGEMNVAEGDLTIDKSVHEHVSGDQITVGDVQGSQGVAIGRGAQAHVTTSHSVTIFTDAQKVLDKTVSNELDKEEAQDTLKKLEEQDKTDPDKARVERYLDKLEKLAPAVVELLINAVTNPGAAIGGALALAIRTWREARSEQS